MSTQSGYSIRQYFIEFGGSMLLYTVTLIGVIATRPHEGALALLELLPAVALLLGFWAIIRQYRRMDEFYQRLHSESFALGALLLGLGVMIWGFGENAGWPPLPTVWIAPALIGLWGLCLPLVMRRYK